MADLRESLRAIGSDLVIRRGFPEVIIPKLAKQLDISAVHYHCEVTDEELQVEAALKAALDSLGVTLKSFWGIPFIILMICRSKLANYLNCLPVFGNR